jgi:hypothetical protein
MEIKNKDLYLAFSVVNIYGSYFDCTPFWEKLIYAGVLLDPHLIVGGDLNFTLSLREV